MKKYERVVAEAIDEYDAETKASAGAVLSAIPLAKHDAKYHHGKYVPGSYCKYREQLAEGDEYDRLDPENVEGEAEELARIKAAKKAAKEREKAARYEEAKRKSMAVTEKTLAALERDYTAREEAMCDDAMRYAMSGAPAFEISEDEAKKVADVIRKGSRKNAVARIAKVFEGLQDQIGFFGEPPLVLNNKSIHSVLVHNGNMFHVPEVIALLNLGKLAKCAMPFSLNVKWKGRNYDSKSYVCPFKIGETIYVCEITCEVKDDPDSDDQKSHLYNVKYVSRQKMRGCFLCNQGTPTDILADRDQHSSQQLPLYQKPDSRVNRRAGLNDFFRHTRGRMPKSDAKGLKEQYLEAMHNPSLLAKQWLAIKYSRALRKVREMALDRYLNSDALEAY